MGRSSRALLAVLVGTLLSAAAPAAFGEDSGSDVRRFLKKGRASVPSIQAEEASAAVQNTFVAESIHILFPELPAGAMPAVYTPSGASRTSARGASTSGRSAGTGGSDVVYASYNADAGPSRGDLQRDIDMAPSSNRAREQAIVEMFQRAGAKDVYTQDIGRTGQRNIMVIKPGTSGKIIVVGAHHDKVNVGRGAVDNWSGAMMVANLYKSLKDVQTEHTLIFATFGAEESGLNGSRQFVSELSREARGNIAAMLNFDCVGVPDGTSVVANGSSRQLAAFAQRAARDGGFRLGSFNMTGGTSDHESFQEAGIATLSFSGQNLGPIHSPGDTPDKIDIGQYEALHKFSTDLIKKMDRPQNTSTGPSERGGQGSETQGRQQSRSPGPARDALLAVVDRGPAVGQYPEEARV